MLIYKATNIQNHKCYIGKTKTTMEARQYWHLKNAKQNSNTHFHNAIRKFGPHNFKWEIVGCCETKEELNQAEKDCIEFFNSNSRIYGYNMTSGGDGFDGKQSTKSRELISQNNAKFWNGKKFSEEHRKKLSESHKGKKQSLETKIKRASAISKMMQTMKNDPVRWAAYCQKISNSTIGKKKVRHAIQSF